MNPVAEEILSYFGISDRLEEEMLHYGTPRHSGRYPWGSGDEPYQRSMDFLSRYEELKSKGMSDTDIAKELNMLNKKGEPSTGILRLEKKYDGEWVKDEYHGKGTLYNEDGSIEYKGKWTMGDYAN